MFVGILVLDLKTSKKLSLILILCFFFL